MQENEYWSGKQSGDYYIHQAQMNLLIERQDYQKFEMLKPKVSIDGDKWCVLYGENLQDGVAGFGDTLHLAILDFNTAFHTKVTLHK